MKSVAGKLTPASKCLLAAAQAGSVREVKRALEKGADIDAIDKHKASALVHAAAGGHRPLVRLLLAEGADVNSCQELRCYSALMEAACKSSVEMIRLLVQAGADVNARDKIGMTALMFAARRGDAGIVKELLVSGADSEIAYEDPNGKRTALDMARECGHPKGVRLIAKWREKQLIPSRRQRH